MAKKINFQVTIGYKAVLTVDIKAETEDQAKKMALEEFDKYRTFGPKITLQDDNYRADGILNMDKTWNIL